MPKSVVIFGRNIPINYISQAQMEKIITNASGAWCPVNYCIYIDKDLPVPCQKRILRHEMGHAVKTITGLDQVIPAEIQEIIVQTFAGLIEDVLAQAQKLR